MKLCERSLFLSLVADYLGLQGLALGINTVRYCDIRRKYCNIFMEITELTLSIPLKISSFESSN